MNAYEAQILLAKIRELVGKDKNMAVDLYIKDAFVREVLKEAPEDKIADEIYRVLAFGDRK